MTVRWTPVNFCKKLQEIQTTDGDLLMIEPKWNKCSGNPIRILLAYLEYLQSLRQILISFQQSGYFPPFKSHVLLPSRICLFKSGLVASCHSSRQREREKVRSPFFFIFSFALFPLRSRLSVGRLISQMTPD